MAVTKNLILKNVMQETFLCPNDGQPDPYGLMLTSHAIAEANIKVKDVKSPGKIKCKAW